MNLFKKYQKILVFGSSGQLAQAYAHCLKNMANVEFVGSQDLDLRETSQIIPFLVDKKPDLIINTSAYTRVDAAEKDAETAFRLNHRAPESMAVYGEMTGATLVHYSTDYVFDGSHGQPYLEDALPRPASIYGESKLAGELAIQQRSLPYYIFRTSWVFSGVGQNFFKTMYRLFQTQEKVSVVCDQFGSPTYAIDLADMSLKALEQARSENQGVYHLSGKGECSWYDFASEILRQMKEKNIETKLQDLVAIPTEAYPTPANRPKYSVLSNEKFHKAFNHQMPMWKDSLRRCLALYPADS